MRIHYNLSGAARKALVTAISEELNLPAHYQGAPTFAYEVGGYQIDKAGMLEGADDHGLVADLLGLHDFKAEREEYDTMPLAEETIPDDLAIPETAALSGGVFQNRLLLRLCDEALQQRGFTVLKHSLVPPNDGGIALGQAIYAMYYATFK